MDELAHKMGISKKTLYQYFSNKEELVVESLQHMLNGIRLEIEGKLNDNSETPLQAVLQIYELAFKYMEKFSPSFLFGLKKYYASAFSLYLSFRKEIVFGQVLLLLQKAKDLKQVRPEIDVKLVCDINFLRMDQLLFSNGSLFDKHPYKKLMEYLIINNIRGIMEPEYLLHCKN